MTQLKKVAIAVMEDPEDGTRGAIFPEVLRRWQAYSEAGFDLQLISETGQFNWDERWLCPGGPACVTQEELAILKDLDHPFHRFLAEIKGAAGFRPSDFAVIFAAGDQNTWMDGDKKAPTLFKLLLDTKAEGIFSFSYQQDF